MIYRSQWPPNSIRSLTSMVHKWITFLVCVWGGAIRISKISFYKESGKWIFYKSMHHCTSYGLDKSGQMHGCMHIHQTKIVTTKSPLPSTKNVKQQHLSVHFRKAAILRRNRQKREQHDMAKAIWTSSSKAKNEPQNCLKDCCLPCRNTDFAERAFP